MKINYNIMLNYYTCRLINYFKINLHQNRSSKNESQKHTL